MCALDTYYQIIALSSRTSWWIKFTNNLAFIACFLHHTILRTKENYKYFVSIWRLHSRNSGKRIHPNGINTSIRYLPATEWHQILPQQKHHFSLSMAEIQTYHYIMLPRWSRIWMTESRSSLTCSSFAKKTLDKNCFWNAQKTMNREPPSFQPGNQAIESTLK